MAETEVESILREIRERVLAQARAGREAGSTRTEAMNGGNGASEHSQLARSGNNDALVEGNLALIQSYLTTTARTWDRLPPLVSNRSGLVAKLELWLKRRLKTATRWFTWEQVNFNAAAHHTLRDLLPVLASQEKELARMRAQLEALAEAQQIEREQLQTELAAQRQTERDQRQTDLAAQRVTLETQRGTTEALRIQTDARFGELLSELRQRIEHLQAEQRVCFKQLALESSEAGVLEDRARRKAESLLEELTRRVGQLEKSDK